MKRVFALLCAILLCVSIIGCTGHVSDDYLQSDESTAATDVSDNSGGHDVATKEEELEANLDAITNENNEIDISDPVSAFKFFWEVIKYEFGYYD